MGKCPNCGRNVASDAVFCPNCGKQKPNDPTFKQRAGCVIGVIVMILVGLNSLCSKCSSGSSPESTPTSLTNGQYVSFPNISFQQNSTDFTEDSYAALDSVVSFMSNHPDVKFEIGGHTDSAGAEQLNLDISESRAQAVKDYLVSKGIAARRLSIRGYGESNPIADNSTSEGRALNRRITFQLLSQ